MNLNGKISRVNYTGRRSHWVGLSKSFTSPSLGSALARLVGVVGIAHIICCISIILAGGGGFPGNPPCEGCSEKVCTPSSPLPKKKFGNVSGMLWPKSLKVPEIPMTWLPGAIDQLSFFHGWKWWFPSVFFHGNIFDFVDSNWNFTIFINGMLPSGFFRVM